MGLWNAADNRVLWRSNFPKIWGKTWSHTSDLCKNYAISLSLLFWQRRCGFKLFPQQKVSDESKFQNASKRQIKIIYFYVIKTPLYKIIAGDSQTHIISNLGLGRRLLIPLISCQHLGCYGYLFTVVNILPSICVPMFHRVYQMSLGHLIPSC